MNNEDNLIPFSERSKEEARELGRKGGIASGEARKKKKLFKEHIELLLSLPLKDKKAIKQLESLGIDIDNIDNQMAMVISMWQKALKGDVNAFNTLRDTVGEKPKETLSLEGEVNNPFKGMTTDELRQLIKDEK
jgi:hypothetical protein